mmetsp:Transcript_10089/g.10041  ORF Transcript_10089/g.10041 Transcript_10089/m.10041 type:complete len:85 (-) Transcript_10089:558-812(-)
MNESKFRRSIVDIYGGQVKQAVPGITGQMNYRQRIMLGSKINKPVSPDRPKSLGQNSCRLYTPTTTKIEGYSQCPRPSALPYQN